MTDYTEKRFQAACAIATGAYARSCFVNEATIVQGADALLYALGITASSEPKASESQASNHSESPNGSTAQPTQRAWRKGDVVRLPGRVDGWLFRLEVENTDCSWDGVWTGPRGEKQWAREQELAFTLVAPAPDEPVAEALPELPEGWTWTDPVSGTASAIHRLGMVAEVSEGRLSMIVDSDVMSIAMPVAIAILRRAGYRVESPK